MNTVEIIISATLRMSVPIVLGSTAASFSTKAGVVSFGCEGMMVTGAFCGARHCCNRNLDFGLFAV